MAVNKVVYNKKTLIDLTADTVNADSLLYGKIAHTASGERITGAMRVYEEFIPLTVTFGTNTVTEKNGTNTITTTFNSDGTVTQVRKIDGTTKTIKTTFNSNGSITNAVT